MCWGFGSALHDCGSGSALHDRKDFRTTQCGELRNKRRLIELWVPVPPSPIALDQRLRKDTWMGCGLKRNDWREVCLQLTPSVFDEVLRCKHDVSNTSQVSPGQALPPEFPLGPGIPPRNEVERTKGNVQKPMF